MATCKTERIAAGVKRILEIYLQEDYDYVALLASRGQRPNGAESVKEQAAFVQRILPEETRANTMEIARISYRLIKALDEEVYQFYNY